MDGNRSLPTSVTVIAWVWIVLGGLMVLAGSMAAAIGGVGAPAEEWPAHMKPMLSVFEHTRIFGLIEAVVGLAGLVGGLFFLRLRAWARVVVEACSWLLLAWSVVFGCYWIYAWISAASWAEIPAGFAVVISVMGVVFGLIGMGMFAVPLGIMIRFLHSKRVRDALRGTRGSDV